MVLDHKAGNSVTYGGSGREKIEGSCEIFCRGKSRAESDMRFQQKVGLMDLRHRGLWLLSFVTKK